MGFLLNFTKKVTIFQRSTTTLELEISEIFDGFHLCFIFFGTFSSNNVCNCDAVNATYLRHFTDHHKSQ